jgi:hypothetical protein
MGRKGLLVQLFSQSSKLFSIGFALPKTSLRHKAAHSGSFE